mmetsp:Transcript_18708/g.26359  ORF Transcript_18708/g.26359 Transcript_18708/m.26359 type:complete len:2041 (+) Transcript_18708:162-6284(+)
MPLMQMMGFLLLHRRHPLEKKRTRSNSTDFLFGSSAQEETGLKGKKQKNPNSNNKKSDSTKHGSTSSFKSSSVLPMGGGGVLQPISSPVPKAALIESLSFQKLAKGTKLLGIVREVTPDYAVVSLPSMLTGFVRRGGLVTRLDHVVSVGTMLPVVVVKTSSETVSSANSDNKRKPVTKKRIELSIMPAQVNLGWNSNTLYEGMSIRGRIISVEDHGCIVDLGISGINSTGGSFLKFDNVEGDHEVLPDEGEIQSDDENLDERPNNYRQQDKINPYTFYLNKGRIYDFTVLSLPSKNGNSSSSSAIIQLKLEDSRTRSKSLTSPMLPSTKAHEIRTLMPGMLVSAYVEHHARNGLCVSFLGHLFRGSIDFCNLGGFFNGKTKKGKDNAKDNNQAWWKDVFVGNSRTVKARLIVADAATKTIRLSLLPHILKLDTTCLMKENNLPSVGTIIEEAKVIRLDSGIGALLALPSKNDSDNAFIDGDDENDKKNAQQSNLKSKYYQSLCKTKCAYVHISKAFDLPTDKNDKSLRIRTPESLFAKHFALNTTIPKLRILSTSNWMDNIASCATAESIVASAALTYNDICPGEVYKAVPIISSLQGGSLLVQLSGMGIKGLVPANHLFDKAIDFAASSNLFWKKIKSEKFTVGKKIDVRCLSVDPIAKKCVLTSKKLLVSDKEIPISSYLEVGVNQRATGFISKVSKAGIIVTFYNNVHGKVSARRLAEEQGVEDPTIDFQVGDVVKARVVSCNKKQASTNDLVESDGQHYKLQLSLNLSESNQNSDQANNLRNAMKIESGILLPTKCLKVIELVSSRMNSDKKTLIPGYAIVSIKSKYLNSDKEKSSDKSTSINLKLPFEQIFDSYNSYDLCSVQTMNELSGTILKVGKKIEKESIIIKTSYDTESFTMPIVSTRSELIKTKKKLLKIKNKNGSEDSKILIPSPITPLFMGAIVHGYCNNVDSRYGAFIRFLDGLTGLVPKLKGGLDINLYSTVLCKVIAVDIVSDKAPKILLKQVLALDDCKEDKSHNTFKGSPSDLFKPGDIIGDVMINDINFSRANVTLVNSKYEGNQIKARIHFTMAQPVEEYVSHNTMPLSKPVKSLDREGEISKFHPFYSWKVGNTIQNVRCVASDVRDGITFLELSNCSTKPIIHVGKSMLPPVFAESPSLLKIGTSLCARIISVFPNKQGIRVQICPGIVGYIAGVELTKNIHMLNAMESFYKCGGVLNCCVIENKNPKRLKHSIHLSVIADKNSDIDDGTANKPVYGALIVGRINRKIKEVMPPSLMIELQGGYVGKCDVTELKNKDEWSNMPLGREIFENDKMSNSNMICDHDESKRIVTDEEDAVEADEVDLSCSRIRGGLYEDGQYVQCRVLSEVTSQNIIEVSLRQTRIDGNLDGDSLPKLNEIVHGYVASTNRKGCFLRFSRYVQGRTILKELSDNFITDPMTMFPPGRLIVGKVKSMRRSKTFADGNQEDIMIDVDMRESTLLSNNENKLSFNDVKEGEKYPGVITRIESYGVFVRLENSGISGLAHLSECSDKYIKNINSLYDPGDLVKVLIVKCDKDKRRLSLSLKASNFEDDSESESSDDDEEDSDDESSLEEASKGAMNQMEINSDVESDDENYANKLAMEKYDKEGEIHDTSSSLEVGSSHESSSDSETSDDYSQHSEKQKFTSENDKMDTDVGFQWGIKSREKLSNDGTKSSDSSVNMSEEEIEDTGKNSKRLKNKGVKRRQEEKDLTQLEQRMADGQAEDNPETSSDFERLIASDPNSSEIWIKYMAYHLSLADIESARKIASLALERIDFREEVQKLNVWTAFITLELKYGTQNSLDKTIERASRQNNPKQVYLRVCEMLEREVDMAKENFLGKKNAKMHIIEKADDMFGRMCKLFKSKKSVWVAQNKYLLKNSRFDEAHESCKKSLSSLPTYKHINTMLKYAQQEYEFGTVERGRTIFEGLIEKNPKRLDIVFVYSDKEVKHGNIEVARSLFQKITNIQSDGSHKVSYSDKQMKSLYKKWYRMEDSHGDELQRQNVKLAAKAYVERSIAPKKK